MIHDTNSFEITNCIEEEQNLPDGNGVVRRIVRINLDLSVLVNWQKFKVQNDLGQHELQTQNYAVVICHGGIQDHELKKI